MSSNCNSPCLPGRGSNKYKIFLVGEAPGSEEDAEGRPFLGHGGRLLRHCIKTLSLDPEEFYLTYAVKCWPINGIPTRKDERRDILEACFPNLLAEFQRLKPEVVVALGATALQVLTENHQATMAQQGMEIEEHRLPCKLVCALHPNFVLKNPSQERELTAAIQLACTLAGIATACCNQELPFNYAY